MFHSTLFLICCIQLYRSSFFNFLCLQGREGSLLVCMYVCVYLGLDVIHVSFLWSTSLKIRADVETQCKLLLGTPTSPIRVSGCHWSSLLLMGTLGGPRWSIHVEDSDRAPGFSLAELFILRCIYWKFRVDREIFHQRIYSPNALNTQNWAIPKPGTRNYIQCGHLDSEQQVQSVSLPSQLWLSDKNK